MARKRGTGIPGLSFSWRRALVSLTGPGEALPPNRYSSLPKRASAQDRQDDRVLHPPPDWWRGH